MKKMKIVLGSAAFMVAVIAAFANKNVTSEATLQQYYVKNGTHCNPTNCSPTNTGTICEFTVYQEDLLNPCSTPVGTTRRP